ncbi:L,D-transpeptidase family protein [Novosphingobium sp. M1R2S20]|uniref:L,D-transpeptidase family protein n=1 Tax=Novosphingobium rhizovicinum TaxID=3228928 RepID=A0ABV3RBY0_9SPHN
MRSASDAGVRPFYEARAWKAAWSPEAAESLREILGERAGHGLDRLRFLPADMPQEDAARDVALTKAALRYAIALSRGAVDPTNLYDVYTLPRPEDDLVAGLNTALNDGRLREWLGGLAPQSQSYRVLSKTYVDARGSSEGRSMSPIALDGIAEKGDSGPHVAAIVGRLRELGFLQSEGGKSKDVYTQEVASAVERLQASFGLTVDGVVGPSTLQALNFGPAARSRALAVALERQRWLERSPPGNRIDVNIAAAELAYYKDGTLVDRRKVVVGEPGNPTPQLQSQLYRLVANPTWTVPKSIERNELSDVSSAYLRRNNMVREGGWIVQQSGPDNALGLVKFDMDNQHAIYLHDTNAPRLFSEERRYFSHGCVRVEDAWGFARMLASDVQITGSWQSARAKDKETFVRLPEPIPVRLIYQDVVVSDGKPVYLLDPYGWNDAIAAKLGFEAGARKRINLQARDIGP